MKPILILFGAPILGIIIALACGCGDELPLLCEPPDVASIEAGIVNGEVSTDRRSTVYVETAGGYCSGVALGPHTVLTAAHCTDPQAVLIEDVAWFDVNQAITHPDVVFPLYDLQILHTLQTLPGPFAPIGLATTCTHLITQGYGVGSDSLSERTVTELGRSFGIIRTTEGTCRGDSGGPLYAITPEGPVLVGITSFGLGQSEECEGGYTGFIDLTVPDIADWVKENTL